MKRIAMIFALAAAGCASANPIPITGPSGRPGYAMQCSGMGRSIEQCYQVAGQRPGEREHCDGPEDGAGGGVQVVCLGPHGVRRAMPSVSSLLGSMSETLG